MQLVAILAILFVFVSCIDRSSVSAAPTGDDLATSGSEETRTFASKQELLRYLQKMNELYGISGRSRFGRSEEADTPLYDDEESNGDAAKFRSKQDVINYWKKMNAHYGVAGRSRFGRSTQ